MAALNNPHPVTDLATTGNLVLDFLEYAGVLVREVNGLLVILLQPTGLHPRQLAITPTSRLHQLHVLVFQSEEGKTT